VAQCGSSGRGSFVEEGRNGRRTFMAKAGGAIASPLLLGPSAAPVRAQSADGQSVVVETTGGQVRGVRNGEVVVFKGIPYAGSPAGEGRFKGPPKLAPWAGVKDALVYGPQAIQPPDPGWPKEWAPAVASEDCLVLNVWTRGTGDGGKRPVTRRRGA
jgi:para-nitrobenzyl esterase